MLTSKTKVEPDLYTSANGHVGAMHSLTDLSPTTTKSGQVVQQSIQQDFQTKMTGLGDYVCAETDVDFVQGYAVPMHVSDHCAIPVAISPDSCVENRGAAAYPTATVSIDMNGCITNGSMRVTPEGMEATCTIVPQ